MQYFEKTIGAGKIWAQLGIILTEIFEALIALKV